MSTKIEYNSLVVAELDYGIVQLPIKNKKMIDDLIITIPKIEAYDGTGVLIIPTTNFTLAEGATLLTQNQQAFATTKNQQEDYQSRYTGTQIDEAIEIIFSENTSAQNNIE